MPMTLKYRAHHLPALFGAMVVFIIFFIDPIGRTVIPISEHSYQLKTFDVDSANPAAKFETLGEGGFRISPGKANVAAGELVFDAITTLSLLFSIGRNSDSVCFFSFFFWRRVYITARC